MNVHLLAVGSELLTPLFRDTNSLYLTERLNDLGYEVAFKGVVGDEPLPLSRAVRRSLEEADIVFVCGGLGPTGDDRTREAVAVVLGRELVLDEKILRTIEDRFRRRGKEMPEANRKQALVIAGAEVLPNRNGTAPGLWISHGGKTAVLLPGPPFELRSMAEESVWPRLPRRPDGPLVRTVLKTTGLTESEVETLVHDLYPSEPSRRLTILASPGQIELHLSSAADGVGECGSGLAAVVREIRGRLGSRIFSDDGAELEEVVGRLLRERGLTLAVAESCSGGLLSHRLTSVPGSSAYYAEGCVTYGNRAKTERLGVPAATIARHGAVSRETAAAMAEGARRTSGAEIGLSLTGIAGPGGGAPEKPVGLVYAALSDGAGTITAKSLFLGPRDRVKFQASQKALDLLRRRLLGVEIP